MSPIKNASIPVGGVGQGGYKGPQHGQHRGKVWREADELERRYQADQPPAIIPPRVSRVAVPHAPGSVAYAVLGGQVIR